MSNNGYTVFEDELTAGPGSGEGGAGFETAFEDEAGWGEAGWGEAAWESGPGLESGYETGFESAQGSGEAWESAWESAFEDEAGTFEGAYEDESGAGGYGEAWESGLESSFEDETGYEAGYETGTGESWEIGLESSFEDESAYEGSYEDESDQFLPFLLPLAAKALPFLVKAAKPLISRLVPAARGLVGRVVRGIAGGRRPGPRPAPPFRPGIPSPGPARRLPSRRRRETVAALLRRLARVLGEGESVAAEAEASFFGTPESSYELGQSAAAHEAALTEVLAAEAAHTESLPEAQAMLGAAVPVTIRIMGARRVCGPVLPAFAAANSRLVRTLATSGPEGRQLLRVVPTIQRRAVASMARAGAAGRLSPRVVDDILAAQAARVLGSPRLVGPALLRNNAVRHRTVAPARGTAAWR
jgi:hypothetical protein